KAEKGPMLDELCALSGWSRRHARRALVEAVRGTEPSGARRGRPPLYGEEVLRPLRKIWATLDGPTGKRLAPFLPEALEAMERHGELQCSSEVRAKLLRISAATIDRLLAPERRRVALKGRSGTKPGSILKAQIPIRTFAEWDDAHPGFFEADLVAHDGGNASGEFCHTLTLTDVASGWTEPRALPNKAHRWVHEALTAMEGELPMPLLGFDSDNGSEFINTTLSEWFAERGVTFTRGRPYRKNDGCYVEQKNGAVVRQAVGYLRYDTQDELDVLTRLYARLRLYVNYFQPQMHLVEKTREGSRVRRRHDQARTPFQRLLDSPQVAEDGKEALRATYLSLNPVALRREITALQARLLELAHLKEQARRKEVYAPRPDHPWRTAFMSQQVSASRTS
ncbi:MAG: integrase catalytic domain-containing protein, partial [Candidatus Methylomirabilales bacterium]